MNGKKFNKFVSKRGIACLWESGGGMSNTGGSRIICDLYGMAKKPIYIKQKGSLSNDNHALIPISVGDYIIEAWHHRLDYEICIYEVKKIDEEIITEFTNEFSNNEWDTELCNYLVPATCAAIKKAAKYHCREAVYILNDDIKKVKLYFDSEFACRMMKDELVNAVNMSTEDVMINDVLNTIGIGASEEYTNYKFTKDLPILYGIKETSLFLQVYNQKE